MRASQVLAIAGPDSGETGWQDNLRWLRALVLLHMAARSLLSMTDLDDVSWEPAQLIRWVIVLTAVIGWIPQFAVNATRVAAVLLLGEVLLTLPATANHVFLEFLLLVFLGLLDERKPDEASLLLQTLRWLIAVMFFYTGLQKLLYGYYFDGQFLAYMAATEDRFTAMFQHIIPAEELTRLQSFNEGRAGPDTWRPAFGAGPYRVDSVLFVGMSNFVYIFEMIAGAALLFARTRMYAAIAAIVFVIMIEVGARELTFGMLMINLLLLFVPGAWVKWLFPMFALAYLYLLLGDDGDKRGGFDLLPMFRYAPP